jgi:uncharacterized membrane protein
VPMPSTPSLPPPSRPALGLLLATSVATAALAVYQWFELLEVRRGGTVSCAINATINCVSVWNSDFASRLHELTGMPVAGLGLTWALAAVALTVWLWREVKRGAKLAPATGALKLWALAGGLSTITFITASLRLGALCLTCLGTYVLVTAFVVAALAMLPGPWFPSRDAFTKATARAMACGAASFLVLLYPGLQTPQTASTTLGVARSATSGSAPVAGSDPKAFAQYFASLPEPDAQFAAVARARWLGSMKPDVSMHPPRARRGPAQAKVHVVDFTDIQCGHCRQFDALSEELFGLAPEGSVSMEARQFPLDGACNRYVPRRSDNGISCLGARVQLCLESSPRFHQLRHELFENQAKLSTELIWTIALKSGLGRPALESCVSSAETQAKLDEDIAYALKYQLEGTPLVVVNGRKTEPSAAFLLGMILAGGDVNAPLFAKLPAPRPGPPHRHE